MSTHLVDSPGDRRTLCGEMADQCAVLWASAASRHQYEMDRCPDCYTAAGLGDMVQPVVLDGQLDIFNQQGNP